MSTLFQNFAAKLIRVGSIEVEGPDGRRFTVGDGAGAAPLVKIADEGVKTALLRDPEMAFGDLYMDGRIDVRRGSIYDVLAIVMRNMARGGGPRWIEYLQKSRLAVQRWMQNTMPRSARERLASL